jgi:recombinational DNA repair protein RecR
MKIQKIEQLELNLFQPKEKLYKCQNCGKMEKRLFQKNFCRACLNQEFKRFTKLIDSVRK